MGFCVSNFCLVKLQFGQSIWRFLYPTSLNFGLSVVENYLIIVSGARVVFLDFYVVLSFHTAWKTDIIMTQTSRFIHFYLSFLCHICQINIVTIFRILIQWMPIFIWVIVWKIQGNFIWCIGSCNYTNVGSVLF